MIIDENAAREMRETARRLFLQTLAESSVGSAFSRHVQYERGVLRVAEDLYPIGDYQRVSVISLGKAANTMTDALVGQLGERAGGIVVGTSDPAAQQRGFRYFTGGHPWPTAESLTAGRALLRYLENQTEHSLVIFLLSGGSSAAAEFPLDEDLTLEDVSAVYRALVLSGAAIAEINAIRKHLSAIKGGRLAQAAAPAQQVSILISDVPDDKLDALGSGPTMPDSTTASDCYAIAERYRLAEQFPDTVRRMFAGRRLEETPKSDDPAFVGARWWPVLSNATARQAAADQAKALGFRVEVDNSCDDWDYARAADYLLDRLRRLRQAAPRVCLISGGEVTVKVTGEGGVGGRNQQFALYCAEKIAGQSMTVFSAGSDGIDGNSPAAGAVADGTTRERARALGLDCAQELARFNTYPVFAKLGDAIVTGPTGNNTRDLRILLAY